jgi:hypothetical protein
MGTARTTGRSTEGGMMRQRRIHPQQYQTHIITIIITLCTTIVNILPFALILILILIMATIHDGRIDIYTSTGWSAVVVSVALMSVVVSVIASVCSW